MEAAVSLAKPSGERHCQRLTTGSVSDMSQERWEAARQSAAHVGRGGGAGSAIAVMPDLDSVALR